MAATTNRGRDEAPLAVRVLRMVAGVSNNDPLRDLP